MKYGYVQVHLLVDGFSALSIKMNIGYEHKVVQNGDKEKNNIIPFPFHLTKYVVILK